MIEDVKHLQPKFEGTAFRNIRHLVECHVVVVDAWSVEHPALGVALRAESIWREGCGVEVRFAIAWIMVDLVSASVVIGHVDAGRVDAVILHLHQVVVARTGKGYGQA